MNEVTKIRDHIKKGKPLRALNLMVDSDTFEKSKNEITLLMANYNYLMNKVKLGLITGEEERVGINKICHSILEMVKEYEKGEEVKEGDINDTPTVLFFKKKEEVIVTVALNESDKKIKIIAPENTTIHELTAFVVNEIYSPEVVWAFEWRLTSIQEQGVEKLKTKEKKISDGSEYKLIGLNKFKHSILIVNEEFRNDRILNEASEIIRIIKNIDDTLLNLEAIDMSKYFVSYEMQSRLLKILDKLRDDLNETCNNEKLMNDLEKEPRISDTFRSWRFEVNHKIERIIVRIKSMKDLIRSYHFSNNIDGISHLSSEVSNILALLRFLRSDFIKIETELTGYN